GDDVAALDTVDEAEVGPAERPVERQAGDRPGVEFHFHAVDPRIADIAGGRTQVRRAVPQRFGRDVVAYADLALIVGVVGVVIGGIEPQPAVEQHRLEADFVRGRLLLRVRR